MSESSTNTALAAPRVEVDWKRNLYVYLFGSFTNVMAMTLMLPFLPVYVEQLGVQGHAAIVQWSGIAFGITFLGAGIAAPIWGKVADRWGRKPTLVRACLAMAICMPLIGVCQTIGQLVVLRLLTGVMGGFASGAVVMVASQTPKQYSAWALGTLSTGVLSGTLLGPIVGGLLPGLVGIRATFYLAGAVIFVAFLMVCFLIQEDRTTLASRRAPPGKSAWSMVEHKGVVLLMYATATMLMLSNMSIEPIVTVFVQGLDGGTRSIDEVVRTAGFVMAVSAFGSIVAARRLGRLADRIGHRRVIVACLAITGLLLIPQAFVTSSWQLLVLRFLMGMSLSGLMPSITAAVRHHVPESVVGTMLGYATSANYAGQVAGPAIGGFVGGHYGMQAVFLATAVILIGMAALNRSLAPPR